MGKVIDRVRARESDAAWRELMRRLLPPPPAPAPVKAPWWKFWSGRK
jgi:hypothetical protein